MPMDDDLNGQTPEQRFHAVASLLAVGVRRLLTRPLLSGPAGTRAGDNLEESGQNSLEPGGETRLSVHTG
jgi:hypothetical protein